MRNTIIKTIQLSKSFANKVVFHNVNIDIMEGETIAFTGENGCGKSTMLKIIGGLINASDGKVLRDPKRKIGYIPERFDKINFTIPEYLSHIGKIDGLSPKQIDLKTEQLYGAFLLQDMLQTPMKFLSKGTLQKVAVIQALLVEPDILLLDEPLSGQDYLSQKKFVELMLELKKKSVTIIMSCHEQYLIEQLADRIFKIEHHNMVEASFLRNHDSLLFHMMLFQIGTCVDQKILEVLKQDSSICELSQSHDIIRIISRKDKGQEILFTMLQHGFHLVKFEEL